jgi:hypothetical protein
MKYITTQRCEDIRKIIDEADRPELLPLEATNHLESCSQCGSFADERTRLRSLLSSPPRVSVPANFNAVLNERLTAAKRRTLGGWIGQYAFMKFSAAAAAAAVFLFAVQYSGVFSNLNKKTLDASASKPSQAEPLTAHAPAPPPRAPEGELAAGGGGPIADGGRVLVPTPTRNRQTYRAAKTPLPIISSDESDFNDGGALLVRMPNSDREIIVPTVNVGAQTLVYSNAGRPAPRMVGTSF